MSKNDLFLSCDLIKSDGLKKINPTDLTIMQPKLPLTFQDKVTHKATKISILTSHSERIKRTSNDVDEEKK